MFYNGYGDNLIYGKNLDARSDIGEASLDTLMGFLSGPDVSVLEVLQNIDLAGSFWSILKPVITG